MAQQTHSAMFTMVQGWVKSAPTVWNKESTVIAVTIGWITQDEFDSLFNEDHVEPTLGE